MAAFFNEDIKFMMDFTDNKIDELYHKIDEYCKNNELYLMEEDNYYLKFDDKFYKVGYTYGPDQFYYIERIEGEVTSYVDYDFLDYNIVSMKNMKMKKKIDDIKRMILELESEGYSKKLIKKAIKY